MPGDSSIELVFAGAAEPECLDNIHALIARLWEEQPGVTGRDRMLFATALVEVAGNIVQHSRTGPHTELVVTLRVGTDRIEAVLVDDGPAAEVDIARTSLPGDFAESGRGLALARAAVDELTYERAGSRNRWRLVRQRSRR